MTTLLAPSSAKIRRERSLERTLSVFTIVERPPVRSSPDGGPSPISVSSISDLSIRRSLMLASPAMQLTKPAILVAPGSSIPFRAASFRLGRNVVSVHGAATQRDQLRLALAQEARRQGFTARRSILANDPARLNGLTKARIEIASRMPLKAPINADSRWCGQFTFGLRSSCRARREPMLALSGKGYPGIDIGCHLFTR